MMRAFLTAAAATALLAACSQPASTPEARPDAASAPAPIDTPDTPQQAMALGLTTLQLENAAVARPDGSGLGEVQRVEVNGAGDIVGLVVAPIGTGERWVRLPLDGLSAKTIGQDHLVVADLTLEQLKAMPAWTP